MASQASAIITPQNAGISYALNKVMPATEGDLFNISAPAVTPFDVVYNQAVLASVTLTVTGGPDTNTSYVVMQQRLADGTWFDIAWCRWTGTTGAASFMLSNGVASANVYQQSRAVGTAPASNGSNQTTLGGQIRFVGKTSLGASSSSSAAPGIPLQVTATITVKLLSLR